MARDQEGPVLQVRFFENHLGDKTFYLARLNRYKADGMFLLGDFAKR